MTWTDLYGKSIAVIDHVREIFIFLFNRTFSLVLVFVLYSILGCLGIRCRGLNYSSSKWFMKTLFLSDPFSGLRLLIIEGFIQTPQGIIHVFAYALNSYWAFFVVLGLSRLLIFYLWYEYRLFDCHTCIMNHTSFTCCNRFKCCMHSFIYLSLLS